MIAIKLPIQIPDAVPPLILALTPPNFTNESESGVVTRIVVETSRDERKAICGGFGLVAAGAACQLFGVLLTVC